MLLCPYMFNLYSPVNLLHTGRYRLVYAIIFGAMSNVFLSLVLDRGGFCTSGTATSMAFCNEGKYSNTACACMELHSKKDAVMLAMMWLSQLQQNDCMSTHTELCFSNTEFLPLGLIACMQYVECLQCNGHCYRNLTRDG